jgi:hypothetical protein
VLLPLQLPEAFLSSSFVRLPVAVLKLLSLYQVKPAVALFSLVVTYLVKLLLLVLWLGW